MSWLKGTRTDGFINIDKNVNFRGTVIGNIGDGIIRPYGALDFYVDGTDGSDTNSGKSWEGAFATVQKAITTQIADTNSKGDIIWVAPGTYAESLTGNLTKVQIIGTTTGCGNPHAVSIRPTTSYSYTGDMLDSAFRNMMFMSPNTSTKTLAAVLPTYMGYSTFDNCSFIGADSTSTVGLQIGSITDDSSVVKCDYSRITNNIFSSFYGAGHHFTYGFKLAATTNTNSTKKQMWHSYIGNNIIVTDSGATTCGIWIGCARQKATGTVIEGNYIMSSTSEHGPTYGIGAPGTMHQIMIIRNYIKAETDGIYNFDNSCTFDNYIGLASAAVVAELPVRT